MVKASRKPAKARGPAIKAGGYVVRAPDGRLFAIAPGFKSITQVTGAERRAALQRPDLWIDHKRAIKKPVAITVCSCHIFGEFLKKGR